MGKHVYTQEERKAQFIKTGIAIAKARGIDGLSISAVAAKHNVTAPLVFHIFGTRAKFRATVAAEAKKQGVELKGGTVAPKRKLTAAQVKAIQRKASTPKPVTRKPTAKKSASQKTSAKKTAGVKSASKAAKFGSLPVPAGEVVDMNLPPKV